MQPNYGYFWDTRGWCDEDEYSNQVDIFMDIAVGLLSRMGIVCNTTTGRLMLPSANSCIYINVMMWRVVADRFLKISPPRREFIQQLSNLCGEYETAIAEIKKLPGPISEEIAQEFTWRQRVRKLLSSKL